jgi:hypothetical protein
MVGITAETVKLSKVHLREKVLYRLVKTQRLVGSRA